METNKNNKMENLKELFEKFGFTFIDQDEVWIIYESSIGIQYLINHSDLDYCETKDDIINYSQIYTDENNK